MVAGMRQVCPMAKTSKRKPETKAATPKRNPQDATSRNVRAAKSRDSKQETRLRKLESGVKTVAAALGVIAAALGVSKSALFGKRK